MDTVGEVDPPLLLHIRDGLPPDRNIASHRRDHEGDAVLTVPTESPDARVLPNETTPSLSKYFG